MDSELQKFIRNLKDIYENASKIGPEKITYSTANVFKEITVFISKEISKSSLTFDEKMQFYVVDTQHSELFYETATELSKILSLTLFSSNILMAELCVEFLIRAICILIPFLPRDNISDLTVFFFNLVPNFSNPLQDLTIDVLANYMIPFQLKICVC
ncbi:hypothetical protein RF11_00375 [Thelohanellus kitauei]|uniref:Uncharacterized protein n=1 Tax=Thelohanellus kitauei TaxID=669202 RepID=A0A0C2IZY2_THEKT|nr:hypothetical protein RF11_00375 [Thelohanellus kitauei]